MLAASGYYGREPSDAAVSEKLMQHATTAGVQDSLKAEETRWYHLGEGKRTERARLEATGCMLSGVGTPKGRFRLNNLGAGGWDVECLSFSRPKTKSRINSDSATQADAFGLLGISKAPLSVARGESMADYRTM